MSAYHSQWPQTHRNLYGFTVWGMQVFVTMRGQTDWHQGCPLCWDTETEQSKLQFDKEWHNHWGKSLVMTDGVGELSVGRATKTASKDRHNMWPINTQWQWSAFTPCSICWEWLSNHKATEPFLISPPFLLPLLFLTYTTLSWHTSLKSSCSMYIVLPNPIVWNPLSSFPGKLGTETTFGKSLGKFDMTTFRGCSTAIALKQKFYQLRWLNHELATVCSTTVLTPNCVALINNKWLPKSIIILGQVVRRKCQEYSDNWIWLRIDIFALREKANKWSLILTTEKIMSVA